MLPGTVGVVVVLLWLGVSTTRDVVARDDTSGCVTDFPVRVVALVDIVGEPSPLGWGGALAATDGFGSALPGILRHYHRDR